MENNKGKSLIIGALVIAVMVMAVGYAALAANLKISGTANITSTWNVAITSITRTDTNGGATDKTSPTSTATTATIDVEFDTPGQFAEYDIVVKNTGSLPAYLKTYTPSATSTDKGIKYTITGVATNDKLAATNGTHTVHVKVEWDEAATEVPTKTSDTFTITLDYAQDTTPSA